MRNVVPGTRQLHVVDAALAVWVLVWIAIAVTIGLQLSSLTNLSHTAIVTGRAVQSVGRSLGVVGNVPLVGGALAGVAQQVQNAGGSVVHGASSTQTSIHTLSVLLAIVVALVPSIPVFGFYLPVRLDLRREAEALRKAAVLHGADPAFQAFLARRALDSLGYHRLAQIGGQPWTQPSAASTVELAAAELERLGIDPDLLDPSGASRGTSVHGRPAT